MNKRSTELFLEFSDPLFGFVFREPVFLLDFAKENVAFAGDLIDFIVGQFTPFFFDPAFELLPIAFYLIPAHVSISSVYSY